MPHCLKLVLAVASSTPSIHINEAETATIGMKQIGAAARRKLMW